MTTTIETPTTGACGCGARCDYLHTTEGARFRLTYDAAGWDADPKWSLPWALDVAREMGGEVAYSHFIHYFPTPAAAMDFAHNLPVWACEELAEELGCEVAR